MLIQTKLNSKSIEQRPTTLTWETHGLEAVTLTIRADNNEYAITAYFNEYELKEFLLGCQAIPDVF